MTVTHLRQLESRAQRSNSTQTDGFRPAEASAASSLRSISLRMLRSSIAGLIVQRIERPTSNRMTKVQLLVRPQPSSFCLVLTGRADSCSCKRGANPAILVRLQSVTKRSCFVAMVEHEQRRARARVRENKCKNASAKRNKNKHAGLPSLCCLTPFLSPSLSPVCVHASPFCLDCCGVCGHWIVLPSSCVRRQLPRASHSSVAFLPSLSSSSLANGKPAA